MKLKTLKDLGKDRDTYSYDDKDVKYFDERVLKTEAVKWVKMMRSDNKTDGAIIAWIQKFFNIGEEDLI